MQFAKLELYFPDIPHIMFTKFNIKLGAKILNMH